MAISLGGTLFLKDGNFFANVKSATAAAGGLKKALGETTTSMKAHGAVSESTGTKLKSLAGKVVGVVAAYASVSAIKSFGEECVTAANNAANANTRLNTIMQQIPGNTQAMTDEINKYASALSKQTTIGGSAQKYGASQLASFQISAQSIKTLMPQLNNLAVAQYGVNVSSDQMVQAANMLGKAYAGQTGAMTRAGIVMTDAQANLIKTGDEATKTATLVEVLKQNFGNLAQEMAKTPEGAWIRLQNSVGALKTKIGTELQPVVTTAMNYIADQMPKIESLVESGINALGPSVTWLTQTAFPAVGNAISSMVEKGRLIYEKISPALSNLKDAFGNVWDSLSGMLGNISSSMGGGGISAVIGDVASRFIDMGAKIIDGIAPIFDFIGEHWNTIQPILGAMLKGFLAFQGLKLGGGIVSGIGGFFGKLQSGGKILKTFGEGVSGAFGLFKASGGGVGNLNSMIGMIGKMGATAGKSLGELGGSFGSVGKLISGLGTSVGGISGIFGKVGSAFKAVGTAILGVNPVILAVVAGIAAAIAVGVLLYKNWDKIKAWAQNLWNGIKEKFGGIRDTIVGAWNTVKDKAAEIWGGIKNTVGDALEGVRSYAKGKLDNIKNAYEEHGGGIKGAAFAAMESVKTYYSLGYDALNTLTGGKLSEVVNSVKGKLTEFGAAVSQKWELIKTSTSEKWQSIKNTVTEKVNGVWSSVSTVFENIRSKISSVFTSAQNTVQNAIEKIKGFFNFKWELPKIKLPHFSISPVGWEFGDLLKGSIPKLGIEWYSKGGIMTRPTVFGMNGSRAMVGGEAGAEAILPLSQFWNRLDAAFRRLNVQPAGGPNVTNNINISIYAAPGETDDSLAQRVASRIVTVLKNM